MKYIIAFVLLLTMVACSTVPSNPVEVKIPVGIPCKIDPPVKPKFEVDKLTDKSSTFDKVKALLAERKQRQGYEIELEAAVKSCQ